MDAPQFSIKDIVGSVRLHYSHTPFGDKNAWEEDGSKITRTPLEEIAKALKDQYVLSSWAKKSSIPEDEDGVFLVSVMRAILIPWSNPLDSLQKRLSAAQSFGALYGVEKDVLELLISEAMLLNRYIPQQLELQRLFIKGDCFAVTPSDFPSSRRDGSDDSDTDRGDDDDNNDENITDKSKLASFSKAYRSYKRRTIQELDRLIQIQKNLPDFVGLLYCSIERADGLVMKASGAGGSKKRGGGGGGGGVGGFFQCFAPPPPPPMPSRPNPYAKIWVDSKTPSNPNAAKPLTGNNINNGLITPAESNAPRNHHYTSVSLTTSAPTWDVDIGPVPIPSGDSHLLLLVQSSLDGSRRNPSDP
eukprot:CAMPEP_0175047306 /NCGR_PEP_ID=MMETSP0052_2-20121109/5518_1 /TAXON_ID=51329 ORGANISM="Polytomella parva, Strain SAG 63-3" /NCGR_SAMPLE_ID=MMETSP0052_2 /ASSEMBLY_ACC=CAM_ASM_000194 /LENGTH=358 /DNA_ID=CAMNT_0016311159 /DNA_START=86 /DNA_END=1158 /DNA_ORIENTATION=+